MYALRYFLGSIPKDEPITGDWSHATCYLSTANPEVSLHAERSAPKWPEWFGQEVTEDPDYTRRAIWERLVSGDLAFNRERKAV